MKEDEGSSELRGGAKVPLVLETPAGHVESLQRRLRRVRLTQPITSSLGSSWIGEISLAVTIRETQLHTHTPPFEVVTQLVPVSEGRAVEDFVCERHSHWCLMDGARRRNRFRSYTEQLVLGSTLY